MDWTRIIDAANGRPLPLDWFVRQGPDADVAALQTLLLLEEAPHAAAALVAAARSPHRIAPLVRAALAPYVAPALADWRADPRWVDRVGSGDARGRLRQGVAVMSGALRERPAALHDAVAIVVRDGDSDAVASCLDALGADGWRALDADERRTLMTRAPADALGRVWDALGDTQRAAAVLAASSRPSIAARLIGRIGAAAWTATDPTPRLYLINAAVCAPFGVSDTAPAWTGMTDDERDALARAVIERGDSRTAVRLLDDLGAAGRATLTVEQREALERRAMEGIDAWRVPAWRAADAGWRALSAAARAALLAAAERSPWNVLRLLRDVGVAGWNAMSADEQARIAVAVRGTPDDLFRCPPALWTALAGDALPPVTDMSDGAPNSWRAEDADAGLGGLPPAHQAVVLAPAPWRTKDAAPDPVRIQRLLDAWDQTSADERVALATAHPSALAAVAAAARLHGGAAATAETVGATVARWAAATGGGAAARSVGAMLRTPAAWRAWMVGVAPSDGAPPEAWAAWIAAARRGVIPDLALCARLAAKERAAAPGRAPRRTGR